MPAVDTKRSLAISESGRSDDDQRAVPRTTKLGGLDRGRLTRHRQSDLAAEGRKARIVLIAQDEGPLPRRFRCGSGVRSWSLDAHVVPSVPESRSDGLQRTVRTVRVRADPSVSEAFLLDAQRVRNNSPAQFDAVRASAFLWSEQPRGARANP